MFLMEKLGPLSSVFFHFTFMIRSLPLASHGLANEPTPFEFAGQSWCGSDAAIASAHAVAMAEGAARRVASALPLGSGLCGVVPSFGPPQYGMPNPTARPARTL